MRVVGVASSSTHCAKTFSTGAVRKDDEYCALCSSAAAAVAIGRVSNFTLCHEVPKFLFLFINFRWGELFCCIGVIICLINPLEGLLVKSYYSVCTSCVSFVNAFRQFYSALRNVVVRSYCLTLWLPPNHVEPLSLASFASCTLTFSS